MDSRATDGPKEQRATALATTQKGFRRPEGNAEDYGESDEKGKEKGIVFAFRCCPVLPSVGDELWRDRSVVVWKNAVREHYLCFLTAATAAPPSRSSSQTLVLQLSYKAFGSAG
ncbi:unnamed protein product [Calypogeia fissa]